MKALLQLCLFVSVFALSLNAEQPKASPRPDPARFAKAIAEFTTKEPEKGGIVFTGNSGITRWKTLKKDFPGLPVLNRGFGGSVANDLIIYADATILQHEPKLLVISTGGNDINGGLTVQETFDDYIKLLTMIHEKLPRTRAILCSLKISPKRFAKTGEFQAMNKKLEQWTAANDWARLVDCTSYLADEKGQPIRKYYVDDLLHLNPEGYAKWSAILRPVLEEEWAKMK